MNSICNGNIICDFYKQIVDKLFAKLDTNKRNELTLLLLSKHDDNTDTYYSTPLSRFIMNNINLISINDLLNYKLVNNNTDINKCIKYFMITDLLQIKIFMLFMNNINYKITDNIKDNIISLIKDWYIYTNKLKCIESVKKDKLYDTYRNIYIDVLIDILTKAKIRFIYY